MASAVVDGKGVREREWMQMSTSEVGTAGSGDAAAEIEHLALARREHFIPLTKAALVDRLTLPETWASPAEATAARRFFRYLDYWRLQTYSARLLDMHRDYEPFSPDNDLLVTRRYGEEDLKLMQRRLVDGVRHILTHANYSFIEPGQVDVILTRESFYGLDLNVDLDVFEELVIAYRGAAHVTSEKRNALKLFRKEQVQVPVFSRLCVLFKLKSDARRIDELVAREKMSREQAGKIVRRRRKRLPKAMRDGCVYIKLFKNLPRSDLEMVFPNTEIRFRMWDKLKLGVTGSGALGAGAFGAAGKIALLATSPLIAAGAVAGLGGVAFRQAMNFSNQRQRYMVVMAQNLYFHAMADNRSALSKLAERAAEEDFKEEILLYSVLAKERARRGDLPLIDQAIETYLRTQFGVDVDFDVEEALGRLIAEGLVTEAGDGTLSALPPDKAALKIDEHWDLFLDRLPDVVTEEGFEVREGRGEHSARVRAA